MKKSFDYFKNLKEMSVAVGCAYRNMVATNEFNKELIAFSGLKWELSDNLYKEFIAPIERNDIYNIAGCLSEEMYCISKLNNIVSLLDVKEFIFVESICSVFEMQDRIFSLFSLQRNNEKTLKAINETKATLNGVNSSVVLSVKNCLKSSDQPLLRYAVISGFFDIYKSIDITFSEVQRVIINNS
ncbi:MAG: hypothetical protein IIX14_05490 [Clostridia bacterium]|nr:hypothetical protein [Clostridia bacterium]